MCGIVGYVGDKECTPILIDGLRRLEYRGYDSAGVAVLDPAKEGLTDVARGALPRQARQPREPAARPKPQRARRHRPHALGDARPPLRRERAPAQVGRRVGGAQRHHREPPALRDELRAARAHASRRRPTPRSSPTWSTRSSRSTRKLTLREAVRRALKQVQGAYAIVVMTDTAPDRSSPPRTPRRWCSGSATARTSSPPTCRRS